MNNLPKVVTQNGNRTRDLMNKSDALPLHHQISIKLFCSKNMEIITCCREKFSFELPSVTLALHGIVYFCIKCVTAAIP